MKSTNSNKGLLTKLILLVLIIWSGSAFLIFCGLDSWSERGTFGDLFGAVNALFSGLAFAGLIYTIILQKEDIEIQRKEIAQNRAELKKSANAQKQQVEQMKLTARLDALKTLIDYYNIQITNPNASEEIIQKAKARRKKIILEIDALIDRIGDDDLE